MQWAKSLVSSCRHTIDGFSQMPNRTQRYRQALATGYAETEERFRVIHVCSGWGLQRTIFTATGCCSSISALKTKPYPPHPSGDDRLAVRNRSSAGTVEWLWKMASSLCLVESFSIYFPPRYHAFDKRHRKPYWHIPIRSRG
jgi:hypothetical protein